MKFFPMVFSLFMFILTANLLGMFPYFFTVTSQIIVTFALGAVRHRHGAVSTVSTSTASAS